MVLPYQNFYWSKIELETLAKRHRYGVVVFPNRAKVMEIATGKTINTFTGDDREALAVEDAVKRIKFGDRHIICCA